jgi:thiosulfate reductase cytochrome b subunit
MEATNPYAPPNSLFQERAPRASRSIRRILKWKHLSIAVVLFPIWFVIGGAISLGGTREEAAIDGLLFLLWLGYLGFAVVSGIISGRARDRRSTRTC